MLIHPPVEPTGMSLSWPSKEGRIFCGPFVATNPLFELEP